MGKKKFNLLIAFFLKESVFWKRTWTMHGKFNWFGKLTIFPISLLFLGIFHYVFAFMHFSFETFLWFVHRGQFNINLNKMRTQLSI